MSIMDEKLAKQVGLRGSKIAINIIGIKGENFELKNCQKVDVDVLGSFGKERVFGVLTSSNVQLPSQTVSAEFLKSLDLPAGANFKPYYNAKTKILIGQDNWRLITSREIYTPKGSDVAISRTSLGWAIHGPRYSDSRTSKNLYPVISSQCKNDVFQEPLDEDARLDVLIHEYFEREMVGIDSDKVEPNEEKDRALKILRDTTRYLGDHWETGLLWKNDKILNINSYPMAYQRLRSLEKKIDRDSKYGDLYNAEMKRFINAGYAVKIDKNSHRSRIWYIPHFGVTNVNKPNKIRLVFDAAAKTNGLSFNEQLDSGPDLLQSLPGVIIRFRQRQIAIKGDISDMFLRVKVREQDRGAQRFLWRGTDRNREPDVYEMNSLIFGAKSSPCSAIFVKDLNAETFKIKDSNAHKNIKFNSYMDDFLASCDDKIEAQKLLNEVVKINGMAGFAMHSWASNDASVLPDYLPSKNSENKETSLGDRGGERVLGLFWDTETDTLKFNCECKKIPSEILSGIKHPTKREVLRVIMSIFDPLGLLAPFTLKSKLMLREIGRSGVGWDNKIRTEERKRWLSWIYDFKNIKDCSLPRCISTPDILLNRVQLHVFCDASLSAYAAVAYLRFERANGEKLISVIMGKSRIASQKRSVPRLELQAALLGASLAKYVQSETEFEISKRFLWSDSTAVLAWIRSEPRIRTPFVSNRLEKIAALACKNEWHWVPTKENPADDATRFSDDALYTKKQWFGGPAYLSLDESRWPKEDLMSSEEEKSVKNSELRKAYVGITLTSQQTLTLTTRLLGWQGLLAIARRVQRIACLWQKKEINATIGERKVNCENYWYRCVQWECFNEEINLLKRGKPINVNSKLIAFQPFIDEDGILRARGRVNSTFMGEIKRDLIVLDGKHFATIALIREYHQRYYHGSINTVLNELRQKYIILRLRTTLRSLAHHCIVCRILRAKPFDPPMADLPLSRTAYKMRPFSHCGIDYFGPLLVKVGRQRHKRWGVLFTCLTSRAIHLDLADSLTASSTIMAIERLASVRGVPLQMYSDNASNFRRAEKDLKEAVREISPEDLSNLTSKKVALKSVKWQFNPPDAPHMGGAWERLIRSVKVALHTVLKDQAPTHEVLITTLAEIAHSVNSRPLTHVSLDPRDEEALTPNHFLIGSSSGEINLGSYDPKTVCLRNQWRLAQYLADMFWKRWLREYLPTLIPRQKWVKGDESIKVGDVVLILDLQAPRNCWKKGKVTAVFPGADRVIRSAQVRTSTGTYERPTRKLIKLLGTNEVQKA